MDGIKRTLNDASSFVSRAVQVGTASLQQELVHSLTTVLLLATLFRMPTYRTRPRWCSTGRNRFLVPVFFFSSLFFRAVHGREAGQGGADPAGPAPCHAGEEDGQHQEPDGEDQEQCGGRAGAEPR